MAQTAADAFPETMIDLVASLPKTTAGRPIDGQLPRSGTSPARNCAEARGAESRADFVHRLRIAVKAVEEVNQTGILLLILMARISPEALVTGLVEENRELARVLSASIRTAQAGGSKGIDDK